MKTPITIELNDRELKLLTELAQTKGLSLEALIKQSARVYQTLEVRLASGQISPEQYKKLFSDGPPKGCGILD